MAHYKVLNLIDFLWKICTIMTREFVNLHILYLHRRLWGNQKMRENTREAENIIDGCREYLIHKNIYNKSEGTR